MIKSIIIMILVASVLSTTNTASAHFFGETTTFGKYQVIFQPFPSIPTTGDNRTTLNFSILEEGANIPVFATVIVSDQSGEIFRSPTRLYEFSDITIPYTFESDGDYLISIEVLINGDPEYGTDPLVASYPISIGPDILPPFDTLILYYIFPPSAAIAAVMIYLDYRKKSTKKKLL
jgi:hypothetical protein